MCASKISCTLFQSTHPVGVGHVLSPELLAHREFQSTHPVGVGRAKGKNNHQGNRISIHPPRGGGTVYFRVVYCLSLFQSTHPVGVGHRCHNIGFCDFVFQSTHPVGVGPLSFDCFFFLFHFNPPTPWGWDALPQGASKAAIVFHSTHPVGVGRRG